MKFVDLFCGWGGASEAIASAGFDVVGVDLVRRRGYKFPFIRADAWFFDVSDFDFVWASPPCNLYSNARGVSPERVKIHLKFDQPYIVENVRHGLANAQLMLCGTMFGLPFRKHRYFASNLDLGLSPNSCNHSLSYGHNLKYDPDSLRNKLPFEYVSFLLEKL